MDFSLIINQILILFIIIFVGYILRKKGSIDEKINLGLTDLLLDVTLPALIITSMSIDINQNLIKNIKLMSLISVLIYIAVAIFMNFIVKFIPLSQKKKTVFKFMVIFGNVGYMGYPVINAIYPEYGIFYAIFNNIVFNVLIWTYGIYLFTKDQDQNKIHWDKLLNNGLIAIIIGFIFLFTGFRLPKPITGAFNILGDMTFPLSMLIIGSSLANVKAKNIFNKFLFLLSGLKLIIIPLILFVIVKQFNLPDIIATTSIILTAMPSPATGVIFAEKYKGDHEFAAEAIFLTSVLSLFTIPLLIMMIKVF